LCSFFKLAQDFLIGLIDTVIGKKDIVFNVLVLTIPTVCGIFHVFRKKPV
jgi:hypothetical protein